MNQSKDITDAGVIIFTLTAVLKWAKKNTELFIAVLMAITAGSLMLLLAYKYYIMATYQGTVLFGVFGALLLFGGIAIVIDEVRKGKKGE